MVEQILLSSGSFAGMRETGGFGQPLHALYPQIRAVLASELGSEAASLLAEPVVDRANNRIDWYTEGDPDRPPVALRKSSGSPGAESSNSQRRCHWPSNMKRPVRAPNMSRPPGSAQVSLAFSSMPSLR